MNETLITKVVVQDRHTQELVGLAIPFEAFDVYLQDAHGATVLTVGEDSYENRKQLIVFAGEDDDALFHLRYVYGTLHHIRRGDSTDAPILADNEADPPEWLNPPPAKKSVRFVVAATNASGESDFYFCKLICSQYELDEGNAHDMAMLAAREQGYSPNLAYDCDNETPGKALAELFVWDSASTWELNDKNQMEEICNGK